MLSRPRYSASPSPPLSSDEAEPTPSEIATERAAMLLALEAHQEEFLKDALPFKNSTSGDVKGKGKKGGKGKEKEIISKSIWEMDEDDFDEEDSASDSEEEEGKDVLLLSFRRSIKLMYNLLYSSSISNVSSSTKKSRSNNNVIRRTSSFWSWNE